MKKLRVSYVIDSLGMGGAERVLLTTLQHLDRDRFEPRVCVLQERKGNPLASRIQALGIDVELVPVDRLRDPRALVRVVRHLRSTRPDLLHVQLEFSNILGGAAAQLLRIPCVSTLHTFDDPARGTRDSWRARLMWAAMRKMTVIAVSEAVGRHHIERGGLSPANVITIYNGVEVERFATTVANPQLRTDLGIEQDAPVLVSVAVLREEKGFQYLIEAMAQIATTVPNSCLVIVGEGEHRQSLQEQTQQLGPENRVIFTGMRTDIAELLAVSDVFVLPTLGDVLPTVVAEAMAAGLPVVASDVGGLPEMVVTGETGVLVPPADSDELAAACLRLLGDRKDATEMGRAGQHRAGKRFDVTGQVRQLEDLYVGLATRTGST